MSGFIQLTGSNRYADFIAVTKKQGRCGYSVFYNINAGSGQFAIYAFFEEFPFVIYATQSGGKPATLGDDFPDAVEIGGIPTFT